MVRQRLRAKVVSSERRILYRFFLDYRKKRYREERTGREQTERNRQSQPRQRLRTCARFHMLETAYEKKP